MKLENVGLRKHFQPFAITIPVPQVPRGKQEVRFDCKVAWSVLISVLSISGAGVNYRYTADVNAKSLKEVMAFQYKNYLSCP